MPTRLLKVVLVVGVAVLCLAYATHNIVNLQQAHAAVAYALSLQDHQIYPSAFIPELIDPAWASMALTVILVGEFAAGIVAALDDH